METYVTMRADTLPHITYLGKSPLQTNWRHFRRTADEYIFYIVADGELHLAEAGNHYALKKGDYILLEPGKEHYGFLTDERCSYYYVHFSDVSVAGVTEGDEQWAREQIESALHATYNESALSDALYSDSGLIIPKSMHVEDITIERQLQTLFEQAVAESNEKRVHYKTTSSLRLMDVFCLLSKSWMNRTFRHSQMDVSVNMFEKTSELLNILHASYHQKITSETIEALLDTNFDYLNRIFKKRTGNTIFQYLNSVRLEQVKELLSTTRLTLDKIADMTGFSDQYYLSRFFKKQIGKSPAQYRKKRIP